MPAPPARLPPRHQLSLRWKAFFVLGLLLGLVHAFLGYVGYRNLEWQSEREGRAAAASALDTLEALLSHAVQAHRRLAEPVTLETSADELTAVLADFHDATQSHAALLLDLRGEPASGRPALWGRRVLAVTDAEAVAPVLD
ncbi:MAG: hypothetical protein ACRES8_07480, partial [Nevskiaceae bacterium]